MKLQRKQKNIKVRTKIECDRPHLYKGEEFEKLGDFVDAYNVWRKSGKTFNCYQWNFDQWVRVSGNALKELLQGKPV